IGSDATLVQSRVCLTVSIFRSARACGDQALARTPWQGATQHTDDLAGSLGLSCVRGASLEQTLVEDSPLATSMPATPATEVQPQDHRNALDSNVLQKTPALAMAEAQTCHRSRKCTKVASEPLNRRLRSGLSHCTGYLCLDAKPENCPPQQGENVANGLCYSSGPSRFPFRR